MSRNLSFQAPNLKFVQISIALFVVATALAGCAATPPPPDAVQSYYKTVQAPPAGFGRIYVFVPESGHYGSASAWTSAKKGGPVGDYSSSRFIAFDVDPGIVRLVSVTTAFANAVYRSSEEFPVASGETIRLRPVVGFRNSLNPIVSLIGGIASAVSAPAPQYERIDAATASKLMEDKSLSSISADAAAVFRQQVP